MARQRLYGKNTAITSPAGKTDAMGFGGGSGGGGGGAGIGGSGGGSALGDVATLGGLLYLMKQYENREGGPNGYWEYGYEETPQDVLDGLSQMTPEERRAMEEGIRQTGLTPAWGHSTSERTWRPFTQSGGLQPFGTADQDGNIFSRAWNGFTGLFK